MAIRKPIRELYYNKYHGLDATDNSLIASKSLSKKKLKQKKIITFANFKLYVSFSISSKICFK